jgi:hypothetical protein
MEASLISIALERWPYTGITIKKAAVTAIAKTLIFFITGFPPNKDRMYPNHQIPGTNPGPFSSNTGLCAGL